MKKQIIFLMAILAICNSALSQNWQQALNGRNVWSLARDAVNNIYAGGLTGSNSRIWKSTDGGGSWDTIYTGTGQTMWDFAFDQSGNIYVANFFAGLLKSTDNGTTFSTIPISAFSNKNPQGVECGSNGFVFVTTSTGFFRSTNSGGSFTETALTGLNCLPVIVDKDSSNIVYVGVTSAGGTGIGFYRSTDNGATFSNNLNPGKNCYNLAQSLSGAVYMITTTSPYNFDMSTDKGLTWTTLGNTSSGQRGVAVGYGSDIYTSGNGGVFKSSNGGSNFSNYNLAITTTPILYVEYDATARLFAGASGSANGGVWILTKQLTNMSGTSVSMPGKFILEQNYPNPFNPSTVIRFELPDRSNCNLRIFDTRGKLISALVNNTLNAGVYEYEFRVDDLPAGIYFYELRTYAFSQTRKMIILK